MKLIKSISLDLKLATENKKLKNGLYIVYYMFIKLKCCMTAAIMLLWNNDVKDVVCVVRHFENVWHLY